MTPEEILPSVEACRAVGCPDLVVEEYLMGRTRRVCRLERGIYLVFGSRTGPNYYCCKDTSPEIPLLVSS